MFLAILDKIRSICKECSDLPVPHKRSINEMTNQHYEEFLQTLDNIKMFILDMRNIEQQYHKMQSFLQKQQAQLRKHIGLEQQLKLYIDSLKFQLAQAESQKLQLLENSKLIIKQLKRQNQKLYSQIKPAIRETLMTSDNNQHSESKRKQIQLTQRNQNQNYSGEKDKLNSKKKDKLVNKLPLSSRKNKDKITPIKAKKQLQNQPRVKVPIQPKKKHYMSVMKLHQESNKKNRSYHNKSVCSLQLKNSKKVMNSSVL